MDKKAQTNNVIVSSLNPPKFEHLKPLSIYPRMITCDQKPDLQHLRFSTFDKLKTEVCNNSINKRKVADSSPDEGYVTPLKKPFSPEALSPDLGCFMDYCSPLLRQQSVSPFATSHPALIDKKQEFGSAGKETVTSQVHLEHADQCGSSTNLGGKEEVVPSSMMCENVSLNLAPVFDYDVDVIFSLNPVSTCTASGIVDAVESCTAPHCTLGNEPFPTVEHSEEVERRVGRENLYLSVKDGEDFRGCISPCINDHKGGGLVNSEQLTAKSNSRLRTAEDGCHQSSSKIRHHEQTATSGCFSIIVDNLSPTVSGRLSEPVDSAVECLEGGVKEVWDIGLSMFESSLCGTVRSNTASDSSLASKSSRHSTEDTSLDNTSESTLPLQVQVKSKVVVPFRHTVKAEETSARTAKHPRTQRPVIFSSRSDWERKKRLYVRSVMRHTKENQEAHHGVMSELLRMMNHVADERAGRDGRRWQHPSDLTRRNYQNRFRTKLEMTLREWQHKNYGSHKRFFKVPKLFERSHFP